MFGDRGRGGGKAAPGSPQCPRAGSGDTEKSQPGPGVGWRAVLWTPRLLPLGLNLSQAWFPHHGPHVTGLIRCPDLGRAGRGTRVWRGEGGSALHRKWSVRLLEVPRTGLAFHVVLSGVSPGPRSESTEREPRARRRAPPWKGIRRGTWGLGSESPLPLERSSH